MLHDEQRKPVFGQHVHQLLVALGVIHDGGIF